MKKGRRCEVSSPGQLVHYKYKKIKSMYLVTYKMTLAQTDTEINRYFKNYIDVLYYISK